MNYGFELRKVITSKRNEMGIRFRIERIIYGTILLFKSFGLSVADDRAMYDEWKKGSFRLSSEDMTTTLSFRNHKIDLFSYVVTEI